MNNARKIRGNAIWNRLTPEQKQKINVWLHDLKLTHRETHQRVKDELGVDCSLATVGRFYQYGLQIQVRDEVSDAQSAAQAIASAGAKLEDLRSSSMQVIATRLLQKAMDKAEVKEITALGRIVLEAEEREIQRQRTALARDRFEFNASKAALAALPLAGQISRNQLAIEQEQIELIKRRLFGDQLDYVIR